MIRHSLLPKLAACAKYESNPVAGVAAQRGTRMDAAFRKTLGNEPDPTAGLTPEEAAAVSWAASVVTYAAGVGEILWREEDLKVVTPGIEHVGTEDARVPENRLSFDLKSGQIRNYREQMAAYALGNMEEYFCETWTCVLLFCDQMEAIWLEFTHEEASRIVDDVLRAAKDPKAKPTACEYCSWCAKKDTCPEVAGPVTEVQAVVQSGVNLAEVRQNLLADPNKLGAFLKACAVFEKELVEPVQKGAKELLLTGGSVPGWKLQNRKGAEYFDHVAVVRTAIAGKSGLDDLVISMGGKMSGKEFRAWSEKLGVPVREEAAHRKDDSVSLVEDKPKKAK